MKYSVRDLSLLIEREKVFVLGLSNAVGRRITSQAAEVLQTVFQRVSKWYCKFVSDPVNLVVNLKRQPRIWKKKTTISRNTYTSSDVSTAIYPASKYCIQCKENTAVTSSRALRHNLCNGPFVGECHIVVMVENFWRVGNLLMQLLINFPFRRNI